MKTLLLALLIILYSVTGSARYSCNALLNKLPTQIIDKENLKLGAVSFPIEEGRTWEQFTKKVTDYIDEGIKNGAQMIVFPELITLDLIGGPNPQAYEHQLMHLAESHTPRFFELIREQAKSKNVHILGGTSPRVAEDGIHNTAVFAYPDGKLVFQDKIYMTPFETLWGWKGTNKINLFETPWGKTSILICYDCEFPAISNMLTAKRPEMILVPSMTSDMSGKNRVAWSAQARAIEHYAYVVVTGTVQASAEPFVGQAAVISPQEPGFPTRPRRSKINTPGMIYETLNMKFMRERREQKGTYPAFDQVERQPKVLTVEEGENKND